MDRGGRQAPSRRLRAPRRRMGCPSQISRPANLASSCRQVLLQVARVGWKLHPSMCVTVSDRWFYCFALVVDELCSRVLLKQQEAFHLHVAFQRIVAHVIAALSPDPHVSSDCFFLITSAKSLFEIILFSGCFLFEHILNIYQKQTSFFALSNSSSPTRRRHRLF